MFVVVVTWVDVLILDEPQPPPQPPPPPHHPEGAVTITGATTTRSYRHTVDKNVILFETGQPIVEPVIELNVYILL